MAFFGIAALVAFLTGMFCFGWAVHAWLNHRLSVFGWSFDSEESHLPFHRAMIAICLFSVIAIVTACYAFLAMLEACACLEL
jgi:hypothetical protein